MKPITWRFVKMASSILGKSCKTDTMVQTKINCKKKQEAFEKCWAHSLLRAVLHCHSPGVATAATVARRLPIDVHDDDNDRGDRYGPMEWAQLTETRTQHNLVL